jgi:5,10-methylenetetrahydromethanopterin reductase
MEFAMLARLYPGRFLPGIGHGVGDWMKQIGAFPPSQLTALEEVTSAVRSLMAGEMVDVDGGYVHLDKVQLGFPPSQVPGISLGVRGPKSLQLSGRVADGTIMSEYASPAYVTWAKEQIATGQRDTGREDEPHRVTVYTWLSVDDDAAIAADKLRPMAANLLTAPWKRTYLEPMGVLTEADALVAEHGDELADRIPDEWVSQLGVVGTVDECVKAVRKLVEAGADSVVFVPVENDLQTLETIASDLLPRLR